MLNQAQRQAVFDGIPDMLCGITLPKQISDQYVASPNVPGIEITYLPGNERPLVFIYPLQVEFWTDFDERGQMHAATSIAALVMIKAALRLCS
jgi:hypothetical protein